jgi:hypothetical protein
MTFQMNHVICEVNISTFKEMKCQFCEQQVKIEYLQIKEKLKNQACILNDQISALHDLASLTTFAAA